jgi:hypothetical protein
MAGLPKRINLISWNIARALARYGLPLALVLAPAVVRGAESIRQAVLAETETEVQVTTTPNAVCRLEHEMEKGLHIQFDADDRGVVRIYVRPQTRAPRVAVRLL